MKLFATVLFICLSSFASSVKAQVLTGSMIEQYAEEAAALTDLHFCVMASEGVTYTRGSHGFILEGLECDKAIDKALEVGVSRFEINHKIQNSLKVAAVENIKRCVSTNTFDASTECRDQLAHAKSLGLGYGHIKRELGSLYFFLTLK